jgi:uncharacterized protein (TIGR02246 family)
MNDILIADYEIRQLYARFVDAAWRQDGDAYAALFTEDGEWKLAAKHLRGREEIGTTFTYLMSFTKRVQMIVGMPILDVQGDSATARVHCTELTKMPDNSSVLAIGIYYDRFARVDGRWLFKWRHFGLHYRGPMDYSAGLVEESPDFGPFPGAPAADEPTLTVFHKK